jgi:hypothetical protein
MSLIYCIEFPKDRAFKGIFVIWETINKEALG